MQIDFSRSWNCASSVFKSAVDFYAAKVSTSENAKVTTTTKQMIVAFDSCMLITLVTANTSNSPSGGAGKTA